MSLLKTNEIQNYNGSSLTLTASTVSTSAQLNTGGNISVTGSLNVSDDSTTRTNLGLGTIATQDSDSITVTGGTATLGALTVSGSDSGNLVRITQTGTGNALVIEDSTNPDSTPFIVDASGNVGIGLTNPSANLNISTGGIGLRIDANAASGDTEINLAPKNSTSSICNVAIVAESEENGFASALYFKTRTSGGTNTERMRINSSGRVSITSSTSEICDFTNSNNVSGDAGLITRLGSNCNNTSSYLFIGETGSANKIFIYGNGNVVNTTGVIGTISDIKLKENISEATPKLNDLMQVRIVNFNLKTEPDLKQIGVIAQELEEIFPNLIDEHPDYDTEGNSLGTTTKSVKMSVFVPILIKAMQEQQTLIESQQSQIDALTARIEALETP